MSEILSVVVFIALLVGLYKMFGHYIAGVILFAGLAAIIGAIFTDGMWKTFAQWGAVIGFAISFIVCFKEALRTFIGSTVGGLIGAGIGYFIPDNSTMWEADLIIGLVLLGGAVASTKAAEELFEETKYRKRKTYRDALGYEHEERDSNFVDTCGGCIFYQVYKSPSCLKHTSSSVSSNDRACGDYSSF